MEALLDRLHAAARAHPVLQRLAIIARILLALAFIPTALVKVQGLPFTVLSPDTPVGGFFDALHRSGAYWRFIGWSQLAAGALLLVPRTGTLGALLYFPIILNIFVITVALRFTGTPVITGLMLLACTFLLCWDYDRLKAVLWPRSGVPATAPVRLGALERAGYALGTVAGLGALLWTRGFVSMPVLRLSLAAGAVALLLVLADWGRLARAACHVATAEG